MMYQVYKVTYTWLRITNSGMVTSIRMRIIFLLFEMGNPQPSDIYRYSEINAVQFRD
jgi:hypothetical protein